MKTMKIAFFDAHHFERPIFEEGCQKFSFEIQFFEARLNANTAKLAAGFPVVCCFVNDVLSAAVCEILAQNGTKLLALRSAGYNHVDLAAAKKFGLTVVRVPAYSPYAVAEHAVAMLLSLNRKIHKAHARVHELNFSLEGLVGFDLHKKTVGVIGTGKIGRIFAKIMQDGFGCKVLAFDKEKNTELEYTSLKEIFIKSDIISLHLPLHKETRHLIDTNAFQAMKKNAFLINTSRGALIDTNALIEALKQKQIGGACLDVYEEEEGIFFEDMSSSGISDDRLVRLLSFPTVLITSHQAFLTSEALHNIAQTTLENICAFEKGAAQNTV